MEIILWLSPDNSGVKVAIWIHGIYHKTGSYNFHGDFIWAQLMVFPFSRGKVLQRAGSYKTTQTGILEKVPSPQWTHWPRIRLRAPRLVLNHLSFRNFCIHCRVFYTLSFWSDFSALCSSEMPWFSVGNLASLPQSSFFLPGDSPGESPSRTP